ncbi:gas vesicle protein GvpJ [Brevibacterium sp. RIT 803]|uniref:gas vesicle protein GvpJ n=1 Tax=Brevibacterium sp. RIT 803 TaxID=2810210 RepID=UPI00195246AD|nr:gas vesicle protein GvpJ [Brevibacterium sp. RIT 803]MBM6589135.1 gas vesicle structural protein GvpA [Brevibacterium sp. RIT 803]
MSTNTAERSRGSYVDRPSSSSLADVVEIILDKGLVIDAYVRVSLVGIEILTIDARIVIASVDTYLRFAEATNRLDLTQQGGRDLPEMLGGMAENGAKGKTQGAVEGVKNALTPDDDEDEKPRRRTKRPARSSSESE